MTVPAPDLDPIEAPSAVDDRASVAEALAELAPSTFRAPDNPAWLTAAQALAELDRQPAHILAVEAKHGFVFGNPDNETGPGQATVAAVCTAAGCDRQGRLLQLHSDTVQPVHCGGCSAVIHCDHTPELRRERSGTLAAVIENLITVCGRCGTELDRVSTDVGPLPLDQIPVSVLEQPLYRG